MSSPASVCRACSHACGIGATRLRARASWLLIHVPGDAVSFWRLPGAVVDEGEDLPPKGLEVAEAGPDRRLQISDRVEQPVVRRPPPQPLPEALDHVQVRAVAGQPVELQVRVVRQRLVYQLAAVPGGVVQGQYHA